MKPSRFSIVLLSLIAGASVAMAGADPTQAFEVSGTVVAVSGGSGSGMPMLTVDDAILGAVDIGLGPIWFLQEAGFLVEADDSVNLLAYPCSTCAVSAVAAWVENLSNETSVDLRDEDGRPLWTHRQNQRGGSARPGQGGGGSGGPNGGGQGGGSGSGTGSGPDNGSGLDMSQIATVTGGVIDFTGHAGAGQPAVTLDVDGETIEIVLSPYQPILAAGLVIEPGLVLTVTFAPTDCDENPLNVALSILDDATGVLVQLRDPETGFPMTNGGGHNRPNWP